ncbi:MAG: glycosyltransferase [Sulfobacillus sp.]
MSVTGKAPDAVTIFCPDVVFEEVARALCGSLRELGFRARIVASVSADDPGLHIAFGLNGYRGPLPHRYIAYQLEQTVGEHLRWFGDDYVGRLKSASAVWDYSIRNIQNLKRFGVSADFVPIGYEASLDSSPEDKDIDVLFYGSLNARRMAILESVRAELGEAHRLHVANLDLWGTKKKKLVARAKIVLNLHFDDQGILECTRIVPAMCCQAVVVSERSSDPVLDHRHRDSVIFAEPELLGRTCRELLQDPDKLRRQSNRGYLSVKTRRFSEALPKEFLRVLAPEAMLAPGAVPDSSSEDDEDALSKKAEADLVDFRQAETETDPQSGSVRLRLSPLDDPPSVSLITVTRNRKNLFPIPIFNFLRTAYPRGLLEWVIVDDGEESLADLLKKYCGSNPRIRYHRCASGGRMSIAAKRNLAASLATGKILVHLDDDDYYFPSHVHAKVALLTQYRDCACVGSCPIGVYDLVRDQSFLIRSRHLPEASMGYTKEFWQENPFNETKTNCGEGIEFLSGRREKVVIFPFTFNIIALTHTTNVTAQLRTLKGMEKPHNSQSFNEVWPFEFQLLLAEIAKAL